MRYKVWFWNNNERSGKLGWIQWAMEPVTLREALAMVQERSDVDACRTRLIIREDVDPNEEGAV